MFFRQLYNGYWVRGSLSGLLLLFLAMSGTAQVKAPKITPLSPNAAALWKFSELPVNLYTGIPSISIPLYEIKSGDITVPISLSYHAGGIRYEEQASWVGLGWSLVAGGAINRNIKGVADEKAEGIFNQTQPMNENLDPCNYSYFAGVLDRHTDVQPDEFSYSMPGGNGRFVYKQGSPQPITMPYAPIRIGWNAVPSAVNSKFELTDVKGMVYRYGGYKTGGGFINEVTTGGAGVFREDTYPSSWPMTEIESADQTKKVSFHYDIGHAQKLSKSDYITVIDNVALDDDVCNFPTPTITFPTTTNLTYSIASAYLTEILFENGKVRFIKSATDRTDIFSNQKSLEYIEVYALRKGTYVLIKKIKLSYSYFKKNKSGTPVDHKLRLDKVQVYGSDNSTKGEEYNFSYHTDAFSGDKDNLNDFNAQDWWGYYNGKVFNTNMIPQQNIWFVQSEGGAAIQQQIGGANRSVDPAFMTEGVLKKIQYPTGGYTEFEFESHRFEELGATQYAGGLRVKKISSTTSASAIPQVKTYKYGPGGNGYGKQNFLNYMGYFVTEDDMLCTGFKWPYASYTVRTFSSVSSMQIDGYDGTPVVYPYVTEINGTESSNNGRTEYEFDGGIPTMDHVYTPYSSAANAIQRMSNSWQRGNQTKKSVFNAAGIKNAETITEYQSLHLTDDVGGLLVDKRFDWVNGYFGGICYYHRFNTQYAYNFYRIKSGVFLPLKTTEKLYDQSDPSKFISSETENQYDPAYLQLTHSKQLLEEGPGKKKELITYTRYPFHYTFSGTPVGSEAEGIKSLQDKYIYSATIEQFTVINRTLGASTSSLVTKGMLNTFLPDKPYIHRSFQFEPVSPIAKSVFGDGSTLSGNAFSMNPAYQRKLTFNEYDGYGSPAQFESKNGTTSVIWQDKGTNPAAEVNNASLSDIAFTSFETEETGNWTGIEDQQVSSSAITGKKGYQLTAAGLQKSGLSQAKTYIVSYWSRSGNYSVPGTTGQVMTGHSTGGWTYYEHKVADVSSVTVSGTGDIDELRLYPSDAQMTTYTYAPLVGMTSQCDISNRISYYEYDPLGRLSIVRDQDQNILKQYCYKYYSQSASACPVSGEPEWENDGDPRCQVIGGYNTGHQLQQQKDMNIISPTYGQTRDIDLGTNLAACPVVPDWIATDSTRCKTDSSGNYTGEQEREEKDRNPYSSTYNNIRWVSNGFSAAACPAPANWMPTGELRCQQEGVVYTGRQEREEKDNSQYSPTYNQTRWVDNGTPAACSTAPDWVANGELRCQQNGGVYTGRQERQERDNNPRSPGHNQTRWVDIGSSATCSTDASWVATGVLRCQQNGGVYSGIQEREEKDNNPYSPTYNQPRWVNNNTPSACSTTPNWQPVLVNGVQDIRCAVDAGNNLTGNVELRHRDVNPYSLTYDQLQWVNQGRNTTVCPVTPTWEFTGNKRCHVTSGTNGYEEREAKDINQYSDTYNQFHWLPYSSTACSIAPVWTATGALRCKKDGSNNNTGEQEKEEKDQNPYSPGYNTTRWVSNGFTVSACPAPPNWTATGNLRCQQNASVYTGRQEKEEKDLSQYSPTYNNLRWVDNGTPSTCSTAPNYQPVYVSGVQQTRCATDVNNNRTGNLEWLLRDMNVYSLTYGQDQWANQGRNTTACPVEPNWSYLGPQRCGTNGYVEREAKDLNPYSDTYNQTHWLQFSMTACSVTPNWTATGNLRCQLNGSLYTGRQELQQIDNNQFSPSYNQTRWIDNGTPSTCSITPNWVSTGSLRCQQNGSLYTGRQELQQQDTNPLSPSYNQTRWVDNGTPAACSITPVWTATGTLRCKKDGSNNNTGEQEKEERDLNTLSATYNTTRWVSNGFTVSACPAPANWTFTGNLRCQQSGSVYTGRQEKEERDLSQYSPTYNSLRWVDNGTPSTCSTAPNNQPVYISGVQQTRCAVDGGNNRTGNLEWLFSDVNVYSLTYGQQQWVNQGRNTTACPVTPNWSYTGPQRCGTNGYVEREARDLNPYSDTYNQLHWLQLSFTACSVSPNWVGTGSLRCQHNGSVYTGRQELQQIDNNQYSPSYNQTRWVDNGAPGTCSTTPQWSATGALSCKKDGSNNNTGEQEREERDLTPHSASYNTTRWVSNGYTVSACPAPANWVSTGETKCQHNGSVYTGRQELKLVDNHPYSPSYGQTQWVDNGAPAACSTTPSWVSTGETRCQAGYTGRQELKLVDNNPYSASYNQPQWVDNGAPASCSPAPNWVYQGSVRCQQNGSGQYTGVQEQYERDMNPLSPSYLGYRWADAGNPSACPIAPNYQPQSSTRCQVINGNSTGHQEQIYRDVNPYSVSYGNENWVDIGANGACTAHPNWSWGSAQRCGTNGYVEREATDINPYSPTYNQTQWLQYSVTACTTNPAWVHQSTFCETFNGSNTGWIIYQYRDMNPYSPSYLQYDNNRIHNPGACPVPCNWSNCESMTGNRCVYGNCEYAPEIYLYTVMEYMYNPNTWSYGYVPVCYYRRTWSDGFYSDEGRPDFSGWQSLECNSSQAMNIVDNKKTILATNINRNKKTNQALITTKDKKRKS